MFDARNFMYLLDENGVDYFKYKNEILQQDSEYLVLSKTKSWNDRTMLKYNVKNKKVEYIVIYPSGGEASFFGECFGDKF